LIRIKIDFQKVNYNLPGEILERLRLVNHFGDQTWQDLLGLNWWDYMMIRSGQKKLPEKSLLRLSDHFDYTPQSLIQGTVDFHNLQVKAEENNWEMPELYTYAAYGRRRTTITSFEYLEKYHGWRLRYDVLKHLNLSESILDDPFAPISMRIITDAFAYLAKRHFKAKDFFAMGMYSFVGNANTILGQHYSQLASPKEIVEHMWSDCLKFYEKNCMYRFLRLDNEGGLLEVLSEPLVAEEMQVSHLGNEHICSLKAGMIASAPMYLGHAQARVVEKCCVHKGADSCIFEITFASQPQHSRARDLES
jgi:predicted hydrocarbon binding protein